MRLAILSLIIFFLPTTPAWAVTRYISPTGSGLLNGSSPDNAYAFTNGAGFTTALAASVPSDIIEFMLGTYNLTGSLTIDKSGTDGAPIIIQGNGFASTNRNDLYQSRRATYPTIIGTREVPHTGTDSSAGNAGTGNNIFSFLNGVDYITIRRFNLKRSQYPFSARNGGNSYITISDIYFEDVRIAFYVSADPACDSSADESYACPPGASDFWDIDRVYGIGVSKRAVRADGLSNSTFDDMYATTRASNGNIIFDEFALMFWNDGAATNNTYTNIECHDPAEVTGTNFDNGDCFGSEPNSSNITFDRCYAFDAQDAGFDVKGSNIVITNSLSFKHGHYGIKAWGTATVTNTILGFGHEGVNTRYSDGGDGRCFDAIGRITATNVTCVNNTRVSTHQNSSIRSMGYVSGSGSAPEESMIITGGTSGATARVGWMASGSTATSGTLHAFNRNGTFVVGELITAPNGFSATTGSNILVTKCGELYTTNSIIARDRNHTPPSNEIATDCSDAVIWNSIGDVTFNEGISGTDPQFPNISNRLWLGDNNDFNSALYTNTKGYYNLIASPSNNYGITITGVDVQ